MGAGGERRRLVRGRWSGLHAARIGGAARPSLVPLIERIVLAGTLVRDRARRDRSYMLYDKDRDSSIALCAERGAIYDAGMTRLDVRFTAHGERRERSPGRARLRFRPTPRRPGCQRSSPTRSTHDAVALPSKSGSASADALTDGGVAAFREESQKI
jgi:hypothetical protein